MHLFFQKYLKASRDEELLEVLAPFYAFRGVVVANPVFYPDVTPEVRRKIFKFIKSVLSCPKFDVARINDYIS